MKPLAWFWLGLFSWANLALAQDAGQIRKVNSTRLIFQGTEQLAYLQTGGRVAQSPFTGVAFTEGDGWRAEVSYSAGVLHGPVTVIKGNRLLASFRYENGKKVLEK